MIKTISIFVVACILCISSLRAGDLVDGDTAFANGDYAEAIRWYKLAASQGDTKAQFNIGAMYKNGQGVSQDFAEAIRWFKLSAAQSNAHAQYQLGLMYEKGQGVSADFKEAVRWYKLASNQNLSSAQTSLAQMLAEGRGTLKDEAEAVRLWILAAEQGDMTPQSNLGFMYYNGYGIRKDINESYKWYLQSALKGNSVAQNAIGNFYTRGDLVKKDSAEAFRWLKASAIQSNKNAQYSIGLAYGYGIGVAINNIKSYMWLLIAAMQKDKDASAILNSESKKLTYKELEVAEVFAIECITNDFRNCGGELDPALPKQNTAAKSNSANKPPDLPTPTKRAPPISLQVTATEPDAAGAVYISVQSNVSTTSLKVNGEEHGGDTAGKYSIKKFAIIGKPTTFTIVATDSNGNTDTKTVTVTRKAVDSAPVFIQLNPNNIKEHSKRDAVAIIIGIQDYKRLARAEYANTDAQVFYDYAVRALGIPAANIKLLVDADAEQLEVYKALRNWLPAKVNKGKTDVYVFYSGHGLPAEDGKSLYLLPYGADKDFLDKTAISQQEINNMLKAAQAKSITLFLDSCYSGQSRTGETLLASARPIALKAQSSSFPPEFTVITATAPEQMSWSSPELKHGIFSYYLMKGMEGDADLNKDGVITMQEMQNYLTENVARQAQRNGRTQLPQLQGDGTRVLVAK